MADDARNGIDRNGLGLGDAHPGVAADVGLMGNLQILHPADNLQGVVDAVRQGLVLQTDITLLADRDSFGRLRESPDVKSEPVRMGLAVGQDLPCKDGDLVPLDSCAPV